MRERLKDKYIDPDEYQAYIDSLNSYRDLQNSIDTAKAEGKAEEKNETALKMLEDGMTIETICKYTGLSQEQIEQLIKETKNV